MKIWYDITNTPQVHFLLAISKIIQEISSDAQSVFTARQFSETVQLMEKNLGEGRFTVVGEHHGKSYLKKIGGAISRFKTLRKLHLEYDVSISCGSESAVWESWRRGLKSIAFGDNDKARQWTYSRFVDWAFFPKAIDRNLLERQGLRGKLYQYDGYKEEIYLSYYQPDSSFISGLPFDNYVVVRPENIMANYIRNGSVRSITPDLLSALDKRGYNILYLPRYDIDRQYSEGIKSVYIPSQPINGLDACYYADAVLTGAGTFAREAACLGVPSFSFYAGNDLLAVDKSMIDSGKMFFSRDVDEIVAKLHDSSRKGACLEHCKTVKEEISNELKRILF